MLTTSFLQPSYITREDLKKRKKINTWPYPHRIKAMDTRQIETMSEPNSPSTQADVKILGSKSPPKPLLSCKILHIPNILKSQVQPTHELRAVYTMLGKQEWASVSILKGRPQSHRRQISGPNKILNTNQACSKHLLFLFLFSAKAVITLPHSVSCHPLILWRVCVHVCACAFHPPCFLRQGLSLAWDSQSRWGWLPCQQAPGPICTCGDKNAPPHLAFLHGSWVSNWGSNTLPNKLPPHLSMVCFYPNTQQDHKLVSSHPVQHGAQTRTAQSGTGGKQTL